MREVNLVSRKEILSRFKIVWENIPDDKKKDLPKGYNLGLDQLEKMSTLKLIIYFLGFLTNKDVIAACNERMMLSDPERTTSRSICLEKIAIYLQGAHDFAISYMGPDVFTKE